ncbi:MAG: SDR family oxidoreductase [Actinomycetota bacterium]|nr:SDR family oxidoreductase [Actinomycetota bacterium]
MTAPLAGSLAGQVAAVTGGGSGIGLAVATAISAAGGSVLLAGRSRERLTTAAATLSGPVQTLTADVGDPATGRRVIEAALAAFGSLDIVIANAGVYLPGDLSDTDPVAAARLIDTNVSGVVSTVAAAVTHFIGQGRGDILVTGSVSGHQAIPWEPVYSASKHAVRALVHGVRRQLVGTGVRIGSVAPGVVLNDLWQVTDEAVRQAEVAAGRGISSEDVADAMMFILTRPRHVGIRDLVILPVNQEI